MKVICISGKARHGKDTLAELIRDYLEETGHRVLIAHFGDLVKYVCEKFFDWDGKKDERGRTLLQYVGTDVVRTKSPDFWVDFIKSVLILFPSEWDYVLIPDCRFPNEFECFLDVGINTYLVRITRPDFDNGITKEQRNHPSETSMDNYKANLYVFNDTTIDALKDKVPTIIENLGG